MKTEWFIERLPKQITNRNEAESLMNILQLLDKETCKRYSEAINRHIKEIEIVILMSQNNYNQILCDDYKNIYSDFSMKKKLKIKNIFIVINI